MDQPPESHTQHESRTPKYEGSVPTMKLSDETYRLRRLSIKHLTNLNNIAYLLEEGRDVPNPTSPEHGRYEQDCGFLVVTIINSLEEAVHTRVNFDIDATPLDVIRAIYETNTTTDHHLLKQEAEGKKLTDGVSIEEYIQTHRAIRTKMRNASYPNISDETITVDFIIKGLDGHPAFRRVPDTCVENDTIPRTIKITENRLKAIQCRLQSRSTAPQEHGPQGLAAPHRGSPARGRDRQRARGRGRGRSRYGKQQYYPAYTEPRWPPPYGAGHSGFGPANAGYPVQWNAFQPHGIPQGQMQFPPYPPHFLPPAAALPARQFK